MRRLLQRLDRTAGLAIDAAVSAHHRRRLRRAGRLEQLEPPQDGPLWAAGEPAPRPNCRLEVLMAERVSVRVLLWAGAPLPVFSPRRSQVRKARDELTRGTKIRCALDSRERPMHCHHEKLVIVDGEVAFAGGIDLTSLGGDRFDSSDHPARGTIGWHDASARLEGPRRSAALLGPLQGFVVDA